MKMNGTDCPQVWFAIPVFNRIALTVRCLNSIRKQTCSNYRVVVCDDGSSDGTADVLARDFPEVVLLKGDGNLWWTGGTNRCIEYILAHCRKGDFVLTLNNDLELKGNYLSAMVAAAAKHSEAILTSASYDIQDPTHLLHPGARVNWLTSKSRELDAGLFNHSGLAEITHAPGRGTLFPVKVFREIGLFDFEHLPHYGSDYDLTHRARRAGYRIFINYDACLYSHPDMTGSINFGRRKSLRDLYRYLTHIKSPACLRYRWRVAMKNCPRLLLPSFLLLDSLFVIGSYFKKPRPPEAEIETP